MKILNEANLVYFSTCPSHTTKEGWLYKRGEINKHFHKRWFVLKGNLLFYFDKPSDKEPNGVIILEGYTVELSPAAGAEDDCTFMICFGGSSNTRSYILQAESQKVMEDWIRVITCASYDYMKIMVAELKAQLDDLTSQELSKELQYCSTTPTAAVDQPSAQQNRHSAAVTSAAGGTAPAVSGSGARVGSSASPQSQRSKARINPFDSHKAGAEVTELDPFGQEPFFPTKSAVAYHSSSADSLEVPKAPERKAKLSPRIRRKIHHHLHNAKRSIHKTKHKKANATTGGSGAEHVSMSMTDQVMSDSDKEQVAPSHFYTDASDFYEEDKLKKRNESNFLNLHFKYGQMIKHVICNQRKSLSDSSSISSHSSGSSESESESETERAVSQEVSLIQF